MTATLTALPAPATALEISCGVDESASFIAAAKATALAIAGDAGRPILNNVLIEISDNEMRLVATNSYVLFVSTLLVPELDPTTEMSMMVDAKQLLTAIPKGRNPMLTLGFDERTVTITDSLTASATTIAVQPGTFPSWRNLDQSDKRPTEVFDVGFSPKYLALVGKAGELFRGKRYEGAPLSYISGTTALQPAYFTMRCVDRGTFHALIMPVRL